MAGAISVRARLARGAAKAALLVLLPFIYLRHFRLIRHFMGNFGRLPNLCRPSTKHEKFLWRKIFDRNPMYRLVSDKLLVRSFIKARCPDLDAAEIIWIGSTPELIPDRLLKPGAIVKTNNGSGRNVLIEQAGIDRDRFNDQIRQWLEQPYGVASHEWIYDRIQPFVFVERVVASRGDPAFVEMCFHVVEGQCLVGTLETDVKQDNERVGFYTPEGVRLRVRGMNGAKEAVHEELPNDFPLPACFAAAVRYAKRIAEDFDYIRVDFMSHRERLFFCECTVFPLGGNSIMDGPDDQIAAVWNLENSWFMRSRQRGGRRLFAALYRSYWGGPGRSA